jgi:Na+/H+-dicarboxylate symporter
MALHTKILAALIAGVAVGAVARLDAFGALHSMVLAAAPVGTIFIRLIGMVVVPLVIASLFVGVASLGDVRRLGRIGGKTLAYFIGTTFAAAIIGCGVALLAGFGPGAGEATVAAGSATVANPGLIDTIVSLVPENPFAAAAHGDLLPLIFAVVLFGAAAAVVPGPGRKTVIEFFSGINAIAMVVIGWLMETAPIAVFVC